MVKIYVNKTMENWYGIMAVDNDKPLHSDHIFGRPELTNILSKLIYEFSDTGRNVVVRRGDDVEPF